MHEPNSRYLPIFTTNCWLRILEQQTSPSVQDNDYANRTRTQELINTVRKALSLQRSLEMEWKQRGIDLDYRWSEQPSDK